jgi:membrane-bound lytic murein transglycosylase D
MKVKQFLSLCAVILISMVNANAQGGRFKNNNGENNISSEASRASMPMVFAPKIPKTYSLFGENIPFDMIDIKERFDRELIVNTYMQGSTIQIIKLMNRWMPMIEERLKINGVPDDFKYLAVAESALRNAVSGVGASGFWQFMKGTAPSYGLEVNEFVDERYNVYKSTDASCKYLIEAKNKLGNWTAAAASYNCGMGGYNGHATKQGSYNFYNLLLPEETMRYIFRIAALKYILENPERSGYMLSESEGYSPLKVRKQSVSGINNLMEFAAQNSTNYKTLKFLNPWLRDKSLPAKGKMYEILLPLN